MVRKPLMAFMVLAIGTNFAISADQASIPGNYQVQIPDSSKIHDQPIEVQVPKGLPMLTPNAVVPASNPLTAGKIELGKQLYFDPRVSSNGTVSCATCHNPEKGWADAQKLTIGIGGAVNGRNAPTVLNTVYSKNLFWDGRAPSLEAQSQGPPQAATEMGKQTHEQIIERLAAIPGYQIQFSKVFGTGVTLDGFAKAIASFERTALSGNSAYDRYSTGEFKALSESAKRGMILFGLRLDQEDEYQPENVTLKKANCTSCHLGTNFSDDQFHNLGVGADKDGKLADLGRWVAEAVGSKNTASIGAFKTPTVRDVTRTAPYMHDGSEATLEAVIEYYNKGGNPNPYLSKDMKPLKLTDQEKKDLVNFLKSLDGEVVPVALPKLPAGPDGLSPDPRAALAVPTPTKAAALKLNVHSTIQGD
ncbi:MAG: c-type cytochrome [Planctomycetota bacterium]|nr:c-type cytochrome [Planctomycetota bacterium]